MEREAARLGGLLGGLYAVAPCLAQVGHAWFTGLGELPGGTYYSAATAVSANGTFVTGCSYSAQGLEAFVWSPMGGLISLGDLHGGMFHSCGYGVTDDGRTVVGEAEGTNGSVPFRWTLDSRMARLGSLSVSRNGPGNAFAVTPDGSVIVGESQSRGGASEAFRWTAGTGMVGLGDLHGGFFSSTGHSVSADGLTVVGFSSSALGNEAFLWRGPPAAAVDGQGVMIGLGELPGGKVGSTGWGVSPDGGVAVGGSISALAEPEAFRWAEATGMVGLGLLPGGLDSFAHSASAGGTVIVGRAARAEGLVAFVWTPAAGMRKLSDVLEGCGINLSEWQLTIAYGVSADGRTIVGLGAHHGGSEAWIARIPAYCGADCNTDGALTVADIACFQARFILGDLLYADCNGDGALNVADWSCFQQLFMNGCPAP